MRTLNAFVSLSSFHLFDTRESKKAALDKTKLYHQKPYETSQPWRGCFFSPRHNEKREKSLWLCSCVIIVCANGRRISFPSKVGCLKHQMSSVGCFLSPNLLTQQRGCTYRWMFLLEMFTLFSLHINSDYGFERQMDGSCAPAFWFIPSATSRDCITGDTFLNTTG